MTLEDFVEKNVQGLALWRDATIHQEPIKQFVGRCDYFHLLVKVPTESIADEPSWFLELHLRRMG